MASIDDEPRLRKSDRTRERILDAAAAAFRERGFAATRLSDIAERANLQAPSLYYHFGSKEELIEEVLGHAVIRTFERVQQAVSEVPEDDPLGRLRAAIETHITMVLQTGDYSAANLRLYGQMPDDIRKRLERTQRKVGRHWKHLLEEARDAGAIRGDLNLSVLRMLILGALNWAAEWYHPGRGVSPKEMCRHATTLLVDGIRP